MGDYAGMSFQQLHDLVMRTDPAAVQQAADHWSTVGQSLAGLSSQLTANRLSLLEGGGWSGKAAQAFYDYTETLLHQVDQARQGATQAHTALNSLAERIGAARTAMGNVPPPSPPNPLERQSVLFSQYGVTPTQVDAENARQKALAIVTELAKGYGDTALVLDATHTALPQAVAARPTAAGGAPGPTGPRPAAAAEQESWLGGQRLGANQGAGADTAGHLAPPPRPGEAPTPVMELAPGGAPAITGEPRRVGRRGTVEAVGAEEGIDPLMMAQPGAPVGLADAVAAPTGPTGVAAGLPAVGPAQGSPRDGVVGGIAKPNPAAAEPAPAVSGGDAALTTTRSGGGARKATDKSADQANEPNQAAQADQANQGVQSDQPDQRHSGAPGQAGSRPAPPPVAAGPASPATPTAPAPLTPSPTTPSPTAPSPTPPAPRMAASAPTPPTPLGAPSAGSASLGSAPLGSSASGTVAALTNPQGPMTDQGGRPLIGPGAVGGAQSPAPAAGMAPMIPPAGMPPAAAPAQSASGRRSWLRGRWGRSGHSRTTRNVFALTEKEAGNPPVIE